ncbi:MAG: polysaccharide deacetylase family protein [Lachnospiraceae bacterium]
MDENNKLDKRKKRIKLIKIYLIVFICFFMILPSILMVIFLFRIQKLEKEIEMMEIQITDFLYDDNSQKNEIKKNEESIQGEKISSSLDESNLLDARKVYLTFDDGPSIHTKEILEILDTYNVKATFFVNGHVGEVYKELYVEIIERGHTLGMHSFSHVYSEIYSSLEQYQNDVKKLQDYLEEVTGTRSLIYRFPGGSSNQVSSISAQSMIEWLYTEDIEYYDWNISSNDASSKKLSAEEIYENCIKDIEDYSNATILFHDAPDKLSTIEALPSIIEYILDLENTYILPISKKSTPVHHIKNTNEE